MLKGVAETASQEGNRVTCEQLAVIIQFIAIE
jgi:hypothetical protein